MLDFMKRFFRALRSPYRSRDGIHTDYEGGFLLDIEQIKQEMAIADRARMDAEKGMPPADIESLSATEQTIVSKLQSELKFVRDIFNSDIAVYQSQLKDISFAAEVLRMQNKVDQAVAEMQVEVSDGKDTLIRDRRKVEQIAKEYDAFRRQHKLHRIAVETPLFIAQFGLLGVVFVLEVGANTLFFAEGSDLGILGGAFIAIVTAFLNVALAWALGYGFRYHNHVSWFKKSFAWSAFLIYITVAAHINLFIGRYRDLAAQVDPEILERAVIISFYDNPYAVETWTSALLIAIGMLFSLFAFCKGYQFDDPYPGFGKLSRRRDEIEKHYADTKRQVMDNVLDIAEEADEALERSSEALDSMARDQVSIGIKVRRRLDRYLSTVSHFEQVGNDLLTVYRETNFSIRKADRPRYFDTPWRLPDYFREVAATEVADEAEIQVRLKEAKEAIAELRQKIGTEREAITKRFAMIEELSERGEKPNGETIARAVQPA